MFFPPPLKSGASIRVIAPCGIFDRSLFEKGLGMIESAGFKIRCNQRIYDRHRYLAGTDSDRARELNLALEEVDTEAIFVARGGFGAACLLPEIRWPKDIAPKWLVGFSDVTALHLHWQSHGVASIHGPNVTTLTMWSNAAREELWELLGNPTEQGFKGRLMRDGEIVEGETAGGNLTVITSLVGTGFVPDMRGKIVVLEDINEKPYRLHRSLFQLRSSGLFDEVRGFVVGQLTGCDVGVDDYSAWDIVSDSLKSYGVPIISDVSIGHEKTSRAMVLGAKAMLDVRTGTFLVNGSTR